ELAHAVAVVLELKRRDLHVNESLLDHGTLHGDPRLKLIRLMEARKLLVTRGRRVRILLIDVLGVAHLEIVVGARGFERGSEEGTRISRDRRNYARQESAGGPHAGLRLA